MDWELPALQAAEPLDELEAFGFEFEFNVLLEAFVFEFEFNVLLEAFVFEFELLSVTGTVVVVEEGVVVEVL